MEGRKFQVWTDHRLLTYVLHQVADNKTARQQRQLSFVAEFTADIRHVPGKNNVVADLLSRPPVAISQAGPAMAASVKVPSGSLAASQPRDGITRPPDPGTSAAVSAFSSSPSLASGVDLTAMAASQVACSDVQELRGYAVLQVVLVKLGSAVLWCDVSSGRQRPLVPADWWKNIFNALHTLAHPGIRATPRLVSARFCWKGLARDVGTWCRD